MILEGRFKITERLGEGTEGIVYLAKDMHLNRYVAIKKAKNSVFENSLMKEADLLKELKTDFFPEVYDFIQNKSGCYLIMEYMEGMTLKQYIEAYGAATQEQGVKWGVEIAEAISILHSHKPPIIYMDLKPQNIICNNDNSVRNYSHVSDSVVSHQRCDAHAEIKIIDFGGAVVKDYEGGKIKCLAGTYGFASPEQLNAETALADERCDIYAFGAVLHYIFSSMNPQKPPYIRKPVREYNGNISEALEELIETCMMQVPEKRYHDMEEVRQRLQQIQKKEYALKKSNTIINGIADAFFLAFILMLVKCGYEQVRLPIVIQNNQLIFYQEKIDFIPFIIIGVLFALGVICRKLGKRRSKRNRYLKKQEKNIFLTQKKGVGLWGIQIGYPLIITLCIAGLTHNAEASELAEEKMSVTVKNTMGQKILIKDDAVYYINDTLILEISQEDIPYDEPVSIQIIAEREDNSRTRSRVFKVQNGMVKQ